MSKIVLTQDNIDKYKPNHNGLSNMGGRRRKLWMSQYCKRYGKKTDFQGIYQVNWKGLPGRCPPTRAQRKARLGGLADS